MIAVVTGASRGIGYAVAELLADTGWLVIDFSRSRPVIGSKKIDHYGVDVRKYAQIQRAVDVVYNKYGYVDLLVNNAGVFESKFFRDWDSRKIGDVIETNLIGTMNVTHAMLSILAQPSRIINISSVAAFDPIIKQSIYCASKAGLNAFMNALSLEERQVLITNICPGGVNTSLWNNSNPYPGNKSSLIKAEEVAQVVDYVASLPPHIIVKKIDMFPSQEWH